MRAIDYYYPHTMAEALQLSKFNHHFPKDCRMFLGLCTDVPVQRELSPCLDSVSDQSFLGGLNRIKHLRPRRSLGGPWAKTSLLNIKYHHTPPLTPASGKDKRKHKGWCANQTVLLL